MNFLTVTASVDAWNALEKVSKLGSAKEERTMFHLINRPATPSFSDNVTLQVFDEEVEIVQALAMTAGVMIHWADPNADADEGEYLQSKDPDYQAELYRMAAFN